MYTQYKCKQVQIDIQLRLALGFVSNESQSTNLFRVFLLGILIKARHMSINIVTDERFIHNILINYTNYIILNAQFIVFLMME